VTQFRNAVRQKAKVTPTRYHIAWNRALARFDVFRAAERTSFYAPDKRTAVNLAILAARKEAGATGLVVIVTSMHEGKRVVEWDGFRESQEQTENRVPS
jgi:hypothetical protein